MNAFAWPGDKVDDLLDKLDVRLEKRMLDRAIAVAISRRKDLEEDPMKKDGWEQVQQTIKLHT
jgi:hypothetical protein